MEPGESGLAPLLTTGLVGEAEPRRAGAEAAALGAEDLGVDLPPPVNIVTSEDEATDARDSCCRFAGGTKAEATLWGKQGD